MMLNGMSLFEYGRDPYDFKVMRLSELKRDPYDGKHY